MKFLPPVLAVLLLLAGCATTPDVTTHYTAFSGKRTDLMSDNLLDAPGPPREVVWLNASRVFDRNDQGTYYLEASYMARSEVGLLEIDPGETLTLLIDGDKTKFFSSGSLNTRKTLKNGLVKEHAIYACTAAQLRQIASAKKVAVGLTGKRGLVLRDFQPDNFDRFQRFVKAYAAAP